MKYRNFHSRPPLGVVLPLFFAEIFNFRFIVAVFHKFPKYIFNLYSYIILKIFFNYINLFFEKLRRGPPLCFWSLAPVKGEDGYENYGIILKDIKNIFQ